MKMRQQRLRPWKGIAEVAMLPSLHDTAWELVQRLREEAFSEEAQPRLTAEGIDVEGAVEWLTENAPDLLVLELTPDDVRDLLILCVAEAVGGHGLAFPSGLLN